MKGCIKIENPGMELQQILLQIGYKRYDLLDEDFFKHPSIQTLIDQMTYKYSYLNKKKLIIDLSKSVIKTLTIKMAERLVEYNYNPYSYLKYIKKALPSKVYREYKKDLMDYEQLKDDTAVFPDFSDELCLKMDLDNALSRLTVKQQKIIRAIYKFKFTEEEIAEKWQVSQQSINSIKARALKQIRKKFDGQVVFLDCSGY
jgi:RNA polymerase sigma factor (sigma-70 family)